MPVKIRLARRGRKKKPFYHIIVADSRAPRDGRFIQKLGIYNPMTIPATIELDRDLAYDWLMKGAQPTDTARAILRIKGVLYRRHLARGVAKGAHTEEQAQKMYEDWIVEKEAKVSERIEQTKKEKAEFLKSVSGKAKPGKKVEEEISPLLETTVESVEADASAEETVSDEVATEEVASADKTESEIPDVEVVAETEAKAEETSSDKETTAEEISSEKEATTEKVESKAADNESTKEKGETSDETESKTPSVETEKKDEEAKPEKETPAEEIASETDVSTEKVESEAPSKEEADSEAKTEDVAEEPPASKEE